MLILDNLNSKACLIIGKYNHRHGPKAGGFSGSKATLSVHESPARPLPSFYSYWREYTNESVALLDHHGRGKRCKLFVLEDPARLIGIGINQINIDAERFSGIHSIPETGYRGRIKPLRA
jgi:hypothetical protein